MSTQMNMLASLALILCLTIFPGGAALAADDPPDFAAIDAYIETQMRELRIPGLALSTDVIVGFPGEEEDDFEATAALMRRVRYDSAFLFKYSRREGTRAAKWDETVTEEEKGRRLAHLIEMQEAIGAEINRAVVGTVVEVLVEGPARRHEGWMMGKTPHMKTVVFPGTVAAGSLVQVRIESSTAHSLRGVQQPPGA